MATLIITVGLPGSGKSREAKEMLARARLSGRRMVRVNRDCLRDMVHDAYHPDGSPDPTETAVTRAARAIVVDALVDGSDVICDDTNLYPSRVQAWRELAAAVGAGFAVLDFTDVPLETVLERNALRDWRGFPPSRWDGAMVDPDVIREMHARHLGPVPAPTGNI